MSNIQESIPAAKLTVGETVKFEDLMIQDVVTSYGETALISFADANGQIIRKVFSNSLAKFLKANKGLKQVTLKKKLVDGKMTFNLYE